MVNSPLIRPYFLGGGGIGGVPLGSHDKWALLTTYLDLRLFGARKKTGPKNSIPALIVVSLMVMNPMVSKKITNNSKTKKKHLF